MNANHVHTPRSNLTESRPERYGKSTDLAVPIVFRCGLWFGSGTPWVHPRVYRVVSLTHALYSTSTLHLSLSFFAVHRSCYDNSNNNHRVRGGDNQQQQRQHRHDQPTPTPTPREGTATTTSNTNTITNTNTTTNTSNDTNTTTITTTITTTTTNTSTDTQHRR